MLQEKVMIMIKKIPNQIIKQPLRPLNLSRIRFIALHHMAHPTADVKTVEKWHINQGWRAIGYNFWVAFDGTIYEGRGFNLGAGVENKNDHIISIGFQGDYHSKSIKMPVEQFNAGVDIINHVMSKLPSKVKIGGHGDFQPTACPGRYFPLEEMRSLKKRKGDSKVEMIYNYIDENMPEWARPTIQKLVDKGLLKGNEKGELGLNDTMLKLLVINDRAGLYN